MKKVFSKSYAHLEQEISVLIKDFDKDGDYLVAPNRNAIKIFTLGGKKVTIKSFKTPNFLNQVIYRFFRPSKAQRSYNYAHKLLDKNILTPFPIAYFEEKSNFLFKRSYYVSELLEYDITYRELIRNSKYAGNEEILSAFARFTYDLHEKGVYFLDHSPGNTLIKIHEDGYEFYLVDLNRMEFGSLDFKKRMENFKRLSVIPDQIAITAKAYAQVGDYNEQDVLEGMQQAVKNFQRKFQRRRRFKKRLKFWKST